MLDDRLEMLSRLCSVCGHTKLWSAFWAAKKHPDGTMQRPQSRCKECVKQARRERRKSDPEWARKVDAADWKRIKDDPDKLALRRELTRENGAIHRRRNGALPWVEYVASRQPS